MSFYPTLFKMAFIYCQELALLLNFGFRETVILSHVSNSYILVRIYLLVLDLFSKFIYVCIAIIIFFKKILHC